MKYLRGAHTNVGIKHSTLIVNSAPFGSHIEDERAEASASDTDLMLSWQCLHKAPSIIINFKFGMSQLRDFFWVNVFTEGVLIYSYTTI